MWWPPFCPVDKLARGKARPPERSPMFPPDQVPAHRAARPEQSLLQRGHPTPRPPLQQAFRRWLWKARIESRQGGPRDPDITTSEERAYSPFFLVPVPDGGRSLPMGLEQSQEVILPTHPDQLQLHQA